jgi:hypothetical protein
MTAEFLIWTNYQHHSSSIPISIGMLICVAVSLPKSAFYVSSFSPTLGNGGRGRLDDVFDLGNDKG